MQMRRIPMYLVGCMVILAVGWAGAAPPKTAVAGKAKPVKGESEQERRVCRRRLQAELKSIPSSPGRANDIVTLLAKQAQMKLKVDWAALAARNIKKDKTVKVNLAGCTIGQGLDILVAAWGENGANMGYYINRGVIHVTTATAMRRISMVRTYDVSDLIRMGTDKPVQTGIASPAQLGAPIYRYDYRDNSGGSLFGDEDDSKSRRMDKMMPFTAEGIVRIILETVEPNSWGTRGSMCPMGPILLVDQSVDAHGKIEVLLAMLRRQFRVSGLMRALTVQAQWVWLDEKVYAKLTSGKAAVTAIISDDILKASKVVYQGVTKCFNGQVGNLTSGNAQNVVLGYDPVVTDHIIAYRPIVEMVQWGAVLDFKVMLTRNGKQANVELRSVLSEPRHPAREKKSQLVITKMAKKATPGELHITNLDFDLQTCRAAMAIPLDKFVLAGGMSGTKNNPAGKIMCLVVKVSASKK